MKIFDYQLLALIMLFLMSFLGGMFIEHIIPTKLNACQDYILEKKVFYQGSVTYYLTPTDKSVTGWKDRRNIEITTPEPIGLTTGQTLTILPQQSENICGN